MFAARSGHLECLKPQKGSILCEVKDESDVHLLLNEGKLLHNFKTLMMGSLGCFMEQNGNMWVVTAAHIFLEEKSNEQQLTQVPETAIMTQYGDESNEKVCVIGEKYNAMMNTKVENHAPHQVDIAVFPVTSSVQKQKLYDVSATSGQESGGSQLKVFAGCYDSMKTRRVWKKGYMTKKTCGEVIDVNVAIKVDKRPYPGVFIVRGQNESHFAVPGDSGSVVFDEDSHQALGIVMAVQEDYKCGTETYKNVAFCTRLSTGLQYVEENLKMSFSYELGHFDSCLVAQEVCTAYLPVTHSKSLTKQFLFHVV